MLERQDYEEFRKAVRRLAETKIQPHAADVDEKKRFPEEALAAFKELQLIALPFDESIGGQSGDVLAQCICLEEIARVCATSSLTLMVSLHMGNKVRASLCLPWQDCSEFTQISLILEPKTLLEGMSKNGTSSAMQRCSAPNKSPLNSLLPTM